MAYDGRRWCGDTTKSAMDTNKRGTSKVEKSNRIFFTPIGYMHCLKGEFMIEKELQEMSQGLQSLINVKKYVGSAI